jgi:hypothetical protein
VECELRLSIPSATFETEFAGQLDFKSIVLSIGTEEDVAENAIEAGAQFSRGKNIAIGLWIAVRHFKLDCRSHGQVGREGGRDSEEVRERVAWSHRMRMPRPD